MTVEQIIILVLAVLLAFAVVAVIVLLAALRKKQTGGRAEDVKIIDGVRYSRSDAVSENGEVRATHRVGDFVLARGEEKTAEKNGELLPERTPFWRRATGLRLSSCAWAGWCANISTAIPSFWATARVSAPYLAR